MDTTLNDAVICSICDEEYSESDKETVVVKHRGLSTLIAASERRRDNRHVKWVGKAQVKFHMDCKKRYAAAKQKTYSIHDKQAVKRSETSQSTTTAVPNEQFNFKELCFYCGEKWKTPRKTGSIVCDELFRGKVLDWASVRVDEIGRVVAARLENIESLAEVHARYHHKCYFNFRAVPTINWAKVQVQQALSDIYRHIETSTAREFSSKKLREVGGEHTPSNQTLYLKLAGKFGSDIRMDKRRGRMAKIFYKEQDA